MRFLLETQKKSCQKKTPLQFGIFFLKKLNMVTQILSIGTLPCFYFFHFQCSGSLVFFFDKNLNFFRILTLSYIFSDYSTKNSCQEKFYFFFKGHNVYLDQKVSFNNLHHTKGSIFSVFNGKKGKKMKKEGKILQAMFSSWTLLRNLFTGLDTILWYFLSALCLN